MLVDLLSNFLLLFLLSGSDGLPDGLHPTPPMGWTSWNTFFEENSQERMITQVTQHTCHVMSCHVTCNVRLTRCWSWGWTSTATSS